MPKVVLKENEQLDDALRRFKRQSNILKNDSGLSKAYLDWI